MSPGKLMQAGEGKKEGCEDLLNQMSPEEGERTREWWLENLEAESLESLLAV